jgi:hypothetical protein
VPQVSSFGCVESVLRVVVEHVMGKISSQISPTLQHTTEVAFSTGIQRVLEGQQKEPTLQVTELVSDPQVACRGRRVERLWLPSALLKAVALLKRRAKMSSVAVVNRSMVDD